MTRAYYYMTVKVCNKLSKRFKRRNRRPRYISKIEQRFYSFMDKFYGNSHLYTVDKVIKELAFCLPYLKWQYENVYTKGKEFLCLKSGYETYGYLDDQKILDNLDYISDRWRCDWRIRWIINMLDKDYINTNKDILDHAVSIAESKVVCSLQEFRSQVVQYNWLFDRGSNKVFIDLAIGSHEFMLGMLELAYTKPSDVNWIDYIDANNNLSSLAEQWLDNNRGAYMTSVNHSVIGKLSSIENRILCQ